MNIYKDLILIDPRSHLEVADEAHRYAKNLRLYFQLYIKRQQEEHIETISNSSAESNSITSTQWAHFKDFFHWLDEDINKPEAAECPRHILDSDTVLYLNSQEDRIQFAYVIKDGLFTKLSSSGGEKDDLLTTSLDAGYIYVVKDGIMYVHKKETKSRPRFQHSSFFSGEPVDSAGMLVCENGRLLRLFPHSGHYRPHDHHLLNTLEYLSQNGCDLNHIMVDAQRVVKVARTESMGTKVKKIDQAHFIDGTTLYNFLKTKQKNIDILNQLRIVASRKGGRHSLSSDVKLSSSSSSFSSFSSPNVKEKNNTLSNSSSSSSSSSSAQISSISRMSYPPVIFSSPDSSSKARANVLAKMLLRSNSPFSSSSTLNWLGNDDILDNDCSDDAVFWTTGLQNNASHPIPPPPSLQIPTSPLSFQRQKNQNTSTENTIRLLLAESPSMQIHQSQQLQQTDHSLSRVACKGELFFRSRSNSYSRSRSNSTSAQQQQQQTQTILVSESLSSSSPQFYANARTIEEVGSL